jgi:hypothetical protein
LPQKEEAMKGRPSKWVASASITAKQNARSPRMTDALAKAFAHVIAYDEQDQAFPHEPVVPVEIPHGKIGGTPAFFREAHGRHDGHNEPVRIVPRWPELEIDPKRMEKLDELARKFGARWQANAQCMYWERRARAKRAQVLSRLNRRREYRRRQKFGLPEKPHCPRCGSTALGMASGPICNQCGFRFKEAA